MDAPVATPTTVAIDGAIIVMAVAALAALSAKITCEVIEALNNEKRQQQNAR